MTQKPGVLHSMVLQRVEHDLVTEQQPQQEGEGRGPNEDIQV